YRAEHLQSGQAVALKTVLGPGLGLLQSLRREIYALARIRHPGVVRILEEGVEDGVPWYAMELVQGLSLRSYIEPNGTSPLQGPGPEREAGQETPDPLADRVWWTQSLARSMVPQAPVSTVDGTALIPMGPAATASEPPPNQPRAKLKRSAAVASLE